MWVRHSRNAVEPAISFAAGDQDVHLGGEPGGAEVVLAREGLFEPVGPVSLQPARDLQPGLVVPDPLAGVRGPVGRPVEHQGEVRARPPA